MIQRRTYDPDATYRDALRYDWCIPALGITIAEYVGRRFGIRLNRRRVVIDFGRRTLLFWGLA